MASSSPSKVTLPYRIIIIMVLLLFSSMSKGQQEQPEAEENTIILLRNIKDTLDTLSLQLKGLQQCSTREQLSELQDLLATDECEEATHNCSEMATCTDSFIQYKCKCLPGYSGDGFTCQDVDECREENVVCGTNEECLNNPGSYACVCREGFEREGDFCQDVDECREENVVCGTNEECLNKPGSYACVCREGFEREGDFCQGPVCEFPSLLHPSLGCLKPIRQWMTWDAAKSRCQDLGMRLAEGIQKQHKESLVQHFHPIVDDYWLWVGLRKGRWLSTSGEKEEEVSGEDWMEGEPDEGGQQCATVALSRSYFGLADTTCDSNHHFLCQFLP